MGGVYGHVIIFGIARSVSFVTMAIPPGSLPVLGRSIHINTTPSVSQLTLIQNS